MGRLTFRRTIKKATDDKKGRDKARLIEATEVNDVYVLPGLGHRLRIPEELPEKDKERLRKELRKAQRAESYFRALSWVLILVTALAVAAFIYFSALIYNAIGQPDG